MDRLRDRRLYNAPQFFTSSAAFAGNDARAIIDPEQNLKGRFLASVVATAWKTDDEPTLALVMARAAPASFYDVNVQLLDVSFGNVAHVAAGVIDRIGACLRYFPESMLFVPPSWGIYIVARVAITANNVLIGGVSYNDMEQAGR